MPNHEKILVLDFGGQYSQLIARRVRDHQIYAEIKSYKTPLEDIKSANYKGIIFTGGPNSVYDEASPRYSADILSIGVPILGICYGAQLIAYMENGTVSPAKTSEYGMVDVSICAQSQLLNGVDTSTVCWMSHTDYISEPPKNYTITAKTPECPCAAMENSDKNIYALQFHPEVTHTRQGDKMLSNFLFDICNCSGDWVMSDFVNQSIEKYRKMIGDKKVLCALSGGVDSSVCAVLLHKAIGDNLTCVFVDHGLLRKNEGDDVENLFREQYNINLIRVNAQDRFLGKLEGVTDPEQKRKIIGEEFIRVFEEESKKLGKINYLLQGTIYPDIVESGDGNAAVIKSHHNVGGLPEHISFDEIIEPLRDLFKDEVRKVGLELGIPENLVFRQPFPGPGLAVRVMGEITRDKLETLREADAIFREEIANAGLDREISQYFAVLTNIQTVGVMGDSRTYEYVLALRAVQTSDFMTADWVKIPYDVLTNASNKITNNVKKINRIVYDITSKPPSTIEWE